MNIKELFRGFIYSIDKEAEEKPIIEQITTDIITMACSNYVYTEWKDGYGNVTKTNKENVKKVQQKTKNKVDI